MRRRGDSHRSGAHLIASALGPEARALIAATRDGDDPTSSDRARVRRMLMTSITAAAAASATAASASAAASAGASMASSAVGATGIAGATTGATATTAGSAVAGATAMSAVTATTGATATTAASAVASATAMSGTTAIATAGATTGAGTLATAWATALGAPLAAKLTALVLAVGATAAIASSASSSLEAAASTNVPAQSRSAAPSQEPAGPLRPTATPRAQIVEPAAIETHATDLVAHEAPSIAPQHDVSAETRASTAPRRVSAETRASAAPRRVAAETRAAAASREPADVADARAAATLTVADPGRAETPPPSTLTSELPLIHAAWAHLRAGHADDALASLDAHAARFPDGALTPERDAARALALCAADRSEEARRASASFLAAHPRSPLAARVRAACP